MAFKASKTRQKKAREPLGVGKPLIPSAAIKAWYESEMNAMARAMIDDYKAVLTKVIDSPNVQEYYAQDASANNAFKKALSALEKKWYDAFNSFAAKASKQFTKKVDEQATSSTLFSLSTAGLKEPRATYSDSVKQTLQAAQEFNNTLITGIQQDVHEKIYTAVMLSLTSPNPEQQGSSGIVNALNDAGHFSKERTKLIARDQTSKVYSALSDDRMRENGCTKFKWMHSSAGKVPRESHVAKDGEIFELNDPRLWEGPKADQGPPGWAINCRCRKQPIFDFDFDS
jgi:SPP1 gp7 family putative phage head morphogenesis protein